MIISLRHCSDADVADIEAQWQGEGYRRVDKPREVDLQVREYIKRDLGGTAAAFNSGARWMLIRREPVQ